MCPHPNLPRGTSPNSLRDFGHQEIEAAKSDNIVTNSFPGKCWLVAPQRVAGGAAGPRLANMCLPAWDKTVFGFVTVVVRVFREIEL